VKRGSVTRHSGSLVGPGPANGLKMLALRLFNILRLYFVIGQSLKYKHDYASNCAQCSSTEWRSRAQPYSLKKAARVGMTYLSAGNERWPSG
jgi:hypothetical protein